MRTSLSFFTEEGRTKSKNTLRRIFGYAALMFFVGAASAYGIHRYWIRSNLTLLQRVYFKQYLKSAVRGALPGARSQYVTLARTVTDPRTKKEVSLAVKDDEIRPVLDGEGYIRRDEQGYPLLSLKPEVERKKFEWARPLWHDAERYKWLRDNFYEGRSLLEIYRPAWLGGLFVFLLGTGSLSALDLFAQRRYLMGKAIRGTRELKPKDYAREHRRETGYGIKVYTQGRGR